MSAIYWLRRQKASSKTKYHAWYRPDSVNELIIPFGCYRTVCGHNPAYTPSMALEHQPEFAPVFSTCETCRRQVSKLQEVTDMIRKHRWISELLLGYRLGDDNG
jgi:hypothetical protein